MYSFHLNFIQPWSFSAAKMGLVLRDLQTRTVTTALADGTNVTQLIKRPIALMGTDCSDTATTEAPLAPNTVFVSGWAAATNLGKGVADDTMIASATEEQIIRHTRKNIWIEKQTFFF
jgi:hypothetical protein